jgi:hypothetical protein
MSEGTYIEGPELPTVASYYVQGRYRRATVACDRGQPLTFLNAAIEWRQRAILRWQTMCEQSDRIAELEREVQRLKDNNQVLKNAVWKACGDDKESVDATIASQGTLR